MDGAEMVGLAELATAIEEVIAEFKRQSAVAVQNAAMAYQRDVQNLAPVDTGQYRASIRVEMPVLSLLELSPYAMIGTDKPQACRLEFGYYGMTDRLGRTFWQSPKPHFRPPLDTQMWRYMDIMRGDLSNTALPSRAALLGAAAGMI